MNSSDLSTRRHWTAPALRTVLVSALLTISSLSCSFSDCRSSDDGRAVFQQVPVPYPVSVAGEDPGEGDPEVRSQSYSLDPSSGEFTFHRSAVVTVGTLGVDLAPLDRKAAKRLEMEPYSGVRVRKVESHGAGELAGLVRDDVILAVDGDASIDLESLEHLIETSKPGERRDLEIQRGSRNIEIAVELGAERRLVDARGLHQILPMVDDRERTGLRLAQLTDEVRPIVLGPDAEGKGLLVVGVLPGGPAFFSGVRAKDLVVRVGQVPTTTAEEFSRAVDAIEPGEKAQLTILRDGVEVTRTVPVEEDVRKASGFNFLGLVKHKHQPERRELDLIFGLLYNYESCFSVRTEKRSVKNVSSRNWGFALNLIRYESTTGGPRKLWLAWFLPIWWGG
jgi:hypothetical protein